MAAFGRPAEGTATGRLLDPGALLERVDLQPVHRVEQHEPDQDLRRVVAGDLGQRLGLVEILAGGGATVEYPPGDLEDRVA